MVAFLSGCVTAEQRATAAGRAMGELEAGRLMPPLPDDCRRNERSGVREGERLDVALLRTDQALGRQNARGRRCAGWYDRIRSETAGGPT